MLDSSGKIPAGLIMLNLESYGFFDECMEINHNYKNISKIKGKYCMARIPVDKFINLDILNKGRIDNIRKVTGDYTAKY